MFILLAMISAQMFTLGNGIQVWTQSWRVFVDKLQPVRRVVVASANVQNALWLFLITTTRCGQISREPRREFRVVAFLS